MEDDAAQPGSKMRRLLAGDGDKASSASYPVKSEAPDETTASSTSISPHPLSHSVSALFRLLHSVLLSAPATPRHSFAVRLLEQVVLLQRGRPPQSPSSSTSSSLSLSSTALQQQQQQIGRARLVLRHLDVGMVAHLVRTVPEMFTVATAFCYYIYDDTNTFS